MRSLNGTSVREFPFIGGSVVVMDRREVALLGLRFSGALLLEAALFMAWFGPSGPVARNPPGFLAPIVALELSRNEVEAREILGERDSPAGAAMRDAVRRGTTIDFLFIVCYLVFYLSLGLLLLDQQVLHRDTVAVLWGVSIAMAFADMRENLALLQLLESGSEEATWRALTTLHAWTYLKWELLAFASALVGLGIWRLNEHIHGFLFAMAAAMGIVGSIHRPSIEWQGFFLGLAWMGAWYKSFPLPGSWARGRNPVSNVD